MEKVRLKGLELSDRFKEYADLVLEGGYKFDKENTEAINACIKVFENNKAGLTIIGNPGSGKTLFFEIMQRILHPNSNQMFSRISVLDAVLLFNNKDIGHGVFRRWDNKNVFFDDLGTESKGYLYGEKIEVFEKFIQFRYDLFRNTKVKTYFTTNLSYDDLKARYGARCVSRLDEMCEVVIMGGNENSTDLRELKNFIGLPPVYHFIEPNPDDQYIKNAYKVMKEKAEKEPPAEREGLGARYRKIFGTPKKL